MGLKMRIGMEDWDWGSEIGNGDSDGELGLGIRMGNWIGDRDWNLGLGIRILDWGLGLDIGDWDLELVLEIREWELSIRDWGFG